MTPLTKKTLLFAHITSSVGWIGAIIPYLGVAAVGLFSADAGLIQNSLRAMELIGKYILVPLSLTAFITGCALSIATPWGLFRHWWITAKLSLTGLSAVVLAVHMSLVSSVACAARSGTLSSEALDAERSELLRHPAGGLVVLMFVAGLSVFRPWGLTPLGARAVAGTGRAARKTAAP
jgi:hypothetical protein